MLYDSEGSRLFECVTTLPEYLPTTNQINKSQVAKRILKAILVACL